MGFSHLTRDKRIKIEVLNNRNIPIKEIAKEVNVHISTVYRELKRGSYLKRSTEKIKKKKTAYSADIAEAKYQRSLKAKGKEAKIKKDIRFKNFIEDRILKGLSPEATLLEVKINNYNFKTKICLKSLYTYIDKDYFENISNKNLLFKSTKKRVYKKVKAKDCNYKSPGTSIDLRPNIVSTRKEFGHWEFDTVIGKKSEADTLLVCTERKTRYEIIYKLKSKTIDEVNDKVIHLKKLFKSKFNNIFKTITCDNGVEFKRLFEVHSEVYYCHPYSSWERGSNEVNNRFIRRFYPKGKSFKTITHLQIERIEEFMNNYPRSIFNGRSSYDLFKEELKKI